jgi:bacteriocin-like protein
MAILSKEQVEQKLQQLKQLSEQVNALTKELVEAGAIKLSDEELEEISGGCF